MTDIVYLHGFNSSPQSLKARETADWLLTHAPDIRLHCPQLPPHPALALKTAHALVRSLPEDTLLVGSSLGGFYATWLAETCNRRAVLVNPAVEAPRLLRTLPASQHHPYTGEDYTLDETDFTELEAHQIQHPDPARFWVILGSADEVLDWRVAMRHFAGAALTVFNGDDHRLARWPECLPSLSALARSPVDTRNLQP